MQSNLLFHIFRITLLILIGVSLYLASIYSYLLFHSVAEIFAVIIAFSVFIIGWHTREYTDNRIYLFLGVAYFSVGCVDILHLLTYQGMNVFPGVDANLTVQLWIAARYIESVSLFLAPLLMKSFLKTSRIVVGYSIITSLLLISIFYWQIFPVCYITGVGLTPFKILSEYAISGILLCAVVLYNMKRKVFDTLALKLLISSILITIIAEMAFTLYIGLFEIPNLLGHYFKIISFFLIYRAIVRASLEQPYDSLFRKLKRSEQWLRNQTVQLESSTSDLRDQSEYLLQNLLDSEERFRSIFNASPISINVFDSNGALVEANKACLEMFGVSSVSDLKGLNLFEDPNLPENIMKKIRKGKVAMFESLFDFSKVKTGEYYTNAKTGIMYLDTVVSPLRYGLDRSIKGYMVQMQDVTKRKKAEEEFRFKESRMEALLQINQMNDASLKEIVSFALEQGIQLTKSQIGYLAFVNDAENVLTINSWSKNVIKECAINDKPRVFHLENGGLWGEAIRQRKPIITNDYLTSSSLKRGYPKGHVKITSHMNLPIFDAGKIVMVVGVGNKEQDYTNYDAQQLRLLMEGVWRTIEHKKTEAKIKAAADTALLYLDLLGHDMRNHLQAIGMSGDILKAMSKDAATDITLEIIYESVRESCKLIDKVQNTRGLITSPLYDVSLLDSLKTAIEIIQCNYEDVIIDVKSDTENAIVSADEFLVRLLVNVMENGVEHNTNKERRLCVKLGDDNEGFVISIADNGVGIPDSKKESLFDPLRRFGGLGVHQALQIVGKYNGHMSVHDRVMGDSIKGTEFLIWLPKSFTLQDTSTNEKS
ncbi:MAG: MASE3 domain-containing protein [Candidatus Thorarchaeota archaeon]